jgi:hypothetical protein
MTRFQAQETISYDIPTMVRDGRRFVHWELIVRAAQDAVQT